jgi:hypothetical protein
MQIIPALLLIATIALAGCGSRAFDDDCSHQMDDLRDDLGAPEEIRRFDSGDRHSEAWWYWRRGFSRTFFWEDGIVGSCDTSDSRFSPIGVTVDKVVPISPGAGPD